jgi:hypothetical protein
MLSAQRLPIIVAMLAMALVSGTIGSGIYYDDYIHRIKLEAPYLWPPSGYGTLDGLFAFGTGEPGQIRQAMESGTVPWWTNPKLKAVFFRPIAALSHWIDYRLWPDQPALMHLHSIFWFGAFIFSAAILYRTLITPLWIAGLAALLFAIDDAHGIPAGWLANRNALIAAVWGVLSLICHHRRRSMGWRAGVVCGPLCFLLGLFSSEAGLGVGAYLAAYEIFLVTAKPREKIKALLPYLMVGLLWYSIYYLWGFGTDGGAYIDPGRDPLDYLTALVERLPVLLYGQWLFPNAVVFGMLPQDAAHSILLVVYGILAVIAAVLWPVIQKDAVCRFWTFGMVFSLLPVCATFPDNRLLLLPGLGAMGLLARLLADWFEKAPWLPASRVWRAAAHVLTVVFILVHLIAAPIFLPLQSQGVARMSDITLERPLLDLSAKTEIRGKTLVFMNPPIPFSVAHIPYVCEKLAVPQPKTVRILASGLTSPLTITRADQTSLEIEAQSGFIDQYFDQLYRGPSDPMTVGERVELSDMAVQILTVTKDQRPLKVRFIFNKSLEDKSLCFYQWQETRFQPFMLPDVGNSIQLPKVEFPL